MILVGSVTTAHKLDGTETKWLTYAEQIAASHPDGVKFFIAVELDSRGFYEAYNSLLDRLSEVRAEVWTYTIDKTPFSSKAYEITTRERFVRIATGRNLVTEVGITSGASHILFVDTDTEPPADALPKLLAVNRALVFGHVPTYCLDGPRLPLMPGDTRQHWSSAGFVLVQREAFRRVRWGWDPDDQMTDDPAYARDVTVVGTGLNHDWAPVTRHDCVALHYPEVIGPLETRGTDRFLRRTH
jgi:hypothetical protein